VAAAQAEPDWISKIRVPAEVVDVTEPADIPVSPLDDLMQRMEQAIESANSAAASANAAAASVKTTGFDFDSESRIKALEDAVAELQSRKQWTEGEIRSLAKDEAEKLMKATVRGVDGSVREVGATSMQVSVAGYSGTFEVKPGERIVAVNGQPIVQRAAVSYRVHGEPVQAMMATTPSVQLQTMPQQRGVVRFWNLPTRNGQCVGGNCP
jgi:hypothetical protein